MPPAATRRVTAKGTISFASAQYKVGVWLAGQNVDVVCAGRAGADPSPRCAHRDPRPPARPGQAGGRDGARCARQRTPAPPDGVSGDGDRKVDSSGNVCFAGASYRAGNKFRRRQVQVAVVGDQLEISIGEQLIRRHKIKHDRTREHGALANPGGRPRRINAA
jgi:hypothetical protein